MTLKNLVEARCIVCQLSFCCADCRRRHEQRSHGLTYDCPICRGNRYLCRPDQLNDQFIRHLIDEHFPLQCRKCNKTFTEMEHLTDIDKCSSISELLEQAVEVDQEAQDVESRFESLYEKSSAVGQDFEAIVSVCKSNKTAVITPIMRKKYLVDYESSDTEVDSPKSAPQTPHPKLAPKTPKAKLKRQRAATPHTKKFLAIMRQNVIEEFDDTEDRYEMDDNNNNDNSPVTNETTPSRVTNTPIADTVHTSDITTPTSHIHVVKLAQAVTTSTPTHPVVGGWSLFPEPGADSPLSEIENNENSAQSIRNEPSKADSDAIPVKLKSIIVTGSRIGLGSQDSSEKQVTFQDSVDNEGSIKTKKVKFADDTVFKQEPKVKRVFRKPRRMLTPGPQKPKSYLNPRFQALLNRFESQAITFAKTPVNTNKEIPQEATPPLVDHNLPARALNFKNEDSPTVGSENNCKQSDDSYKSCIDSSNQPINNAIAALTTNIAGSLQNCLDSALRTTEEETEIQFKFVITKRKVSVKRIVDDGEGIDEKSSEIEREADHHKENIWTTVARAVKNVFWGDQASRTPSTPYMSLDSRESTSSASKRKFEELSDCDLSPLNHKRHKYEGRIRGRPPLPRANPLMVAGLRSYRSDEQHLLRKTPAEDELNLSF